MECSLACRPIAGASFFSDHRAYTVAAVLLGLAILVAVALNSQQLQAGARSA
jgi:hypothetical protein